MSDEKKQNDWLKSLLKPDKQGKKMNRKSQYILLILGFGIAMMLIQNLISTPDSTPTMNSATEDEESKATFSIKKSDDPSSIREMEEHYGNQLKEILDEMMGVQDTSVMVFLDSTSKTIYEKDITKKDSTTDETDQHGGKRKTTDLQTDEKVIIIQGEKGEQPIIVTTEKPEVRGVLILADGAQNIKVKTWIIEAVSRVLDVPSHKVSVGPKKQKGE
ncbi:stage III sporulation protein AG [Bacillus sp. Marseille-Q3570]|uniref:stage III sporulation protein AG n=1 Tax=Bacillus sp. Marseille-Q3570 TaxID=2963522 RepID=UPI0021B7DA45|nr:stage III sporulation protein AG [Bacillus sp. Marseille-Q3570]